MVPLPVLREDVEVFLGKYRLESSNAVGRNVHLHFSGLPIDLWVVVLEPGITEDHTLSSEAGDSEEHPFGVGFVTENHVYHFRDLTCLVGRAIHIVH